MKNNMKGAQKTKINMINKLNPQVAKVNKIIRRKIKNRRQWRSQNQNNQIMFGVILKRVKDQMIIRQNNPFL